MVKRAVLYARVSSDDRGNHGRNLKGQIEMCREYALEKGYTVVSELTEDDRGASGASFDLEKLNLALEMARNGEFDVLVVRELDRFARSLAKQLIVETEFKRADVEIDYVLGEYSDTPEGNLMKNVRAVIAENAPDDERFIPELMAMLGDPKSFLRSRAEKSLMALGAIAPAIEPGTTEIAAVGKRLEA